MSITLFIVTGALAVFLGVALLVISFFIKNEKVQNCFIGYGAYTIFIGAIMVFGGLITYAILV